MNKQALLLKSHQDLFHTKDLVLLWNTDNKNTLHIIKNKISQKIINEDFNSIKKTLKIETLAILDEEIRNLS